MKNIIACAGEEIELSGIPNEIKILPLGRVHSQKGDFDVDEESFSLIQKQFQNRKIDIVIDYEHQTLSDVQAPAGGWIKDMYKGEDAIVAKVEWTKKAAEYLKNKEYRYLSPVLGVRKRDKKATVLYSAALTNTPAIDGMFALVNSLDIEDISEGGNKMELSELAKLLGLEETATEEEVKKAAADAVRAQEKLKELEIKKPDANEGTANKEDSETVANSTILTMLGLKDNARTEDVAATIMALRTGGMDTQKEVIALKEQLQARRADELVELALKEGKIAPAQQDWAREYAMKDESGFQSFVEKAPAVVPFGKLDLKDAPAAKEEYDITILKNTGVDLEDAKKYEDRRKQDE